MKQRKGNHLIRRKNTNVWIKAARDYNKPNRRF